MVSDPAAWVDDYAKAGADMFTFHLEAVPDAAAQAALCARVRAAGMHCGVSVCPETPVESVFALADSGAVDMVLVMTVRPGFGGQKFMPDMMPKVRPGVGRRGAPAGMAGGRPAGPGTPRGGDASASPDGAAPLRLAPQVRALRERYPELHIEVDGGLAPATIDEAAAAGANVIVAGSAVFGAADPGAVIAGLRGSVDRAAAAGA